MELVLKIKTPSISAYKPWPYATSKGVLGRLKGVHIQVVWDKHRIFSSNIVNIIYFISLFSLFHLPDQVDAKQNFIHRDKKRVHTDV